MKVAAPSAGYRILSFLLFPMWVLHALWLSIKNHQLEYLLQRLGIIRGNGTYDIWIHASSVGEVELIRPLVMDLHKTHSIVVTTFTPTGFNHASKIMLEMASVQVLPIDFHPLSRRFIRRSGVKLALIAETELWPETLFQAKKHGTKLLSINSRLSNKSLNTASWIKRILVQTLGLFDRFITRSDADSDRLQKMQVPEAGISICGNLKLACLQDKAEYTNLIGRPYILFASTHAPEEAEFAQMFRELESDYICVIAPRHPQRAKEIMRTLNTLTPHVGQRSKQHPIQPHTEIYLADTLGELKALIQHAELVVMGGSFHQVGGHNVLEAASLGKAVITGPSDSNIQKDIEMLAQHQAIIQVDHLQGLKQCLQQLITDDEKLASLSHNAAAIMQQQEHILQCYLKEIKRYL